MSSQGSPRLELDLRQRRWERRVAWLALVLGPASFLLTAPRPAAFGYALAMALLVAGGLLRSGWIGDRERIQRVVWSSDGRWLLTDARGRLFEATLRADSRVGDGFVWLRWNANQTRSMLLVSGDVAAADLRQLIVRLRLEGLRPLGNQGRPLKMQLS